MGFVLSIPVVTHPGDISPAILQFVECNIGILKCHFLRHIVPPQNPAKLIKKCILCISSDRVLEWVGCSHLPSPRTKADPRPNYKGLISSWGLTFGTKYCIPASGFFKVFWDHKPKKCSQNDFFSGCKKKKEKKPMN